MKRILTDDHKRVAAFVSERMGVTGFGDYVGIGLEDNGRLIAGVLYDYYNGASINMHVAAVGKRWLTREYLHFCFWYPFEQMKVKRITAIVPTANSASVRFTEHIGFRREAVLKDACPSGDVYIYRMFRHECRWLYLKVKYAQAA